MGAPIPPAVGGSDHRPASISDEDRALFVEFLVSARRRSGRSLDEITLITKVPPRHLEALEQGRVEALPGGLYRRAIVRNYARAVGLDPNVALERFGQLCGNEAILPEWQGIPGIPMTPQSTGMLRQAIALAPAAATRLPSVRLLANPAQILPALPRLLEQLRPLALAAAISIAVVIAALFILDGTRSARDGVEPAVAVALPAATTTTRTQPVAAKTDGPGAATANQGSLAPAAESAPAPVSLSLSAANGPQPPVEPGPAAAESRLVITSVPSGARVTVNGIGWGVTPITIRYLPPGVKVVRVTKDGYVSQERQGRVGEEGGAHAVAITLEARD